MENQTEIWKDIKGYEGHYQVSNLGRIKSLERIAWNGHVNHILKGKILKLCFDGKKRYLLIDLCKNCKSFKFLVHRLVLETFIENTENKREVNHINGIKTDNNLSNLEWNTSSENRFHAFRNGLKVIPKGILNKNNKKVYQYSINNEFINEFYSITYAVNFLGLNGSNISIALNKDYRTSGGFKWKTIKQNEI